MIKAIKKAFKNRIVKNAGWLMIGRVIHMILSFVIGLLTARYLGPSNFGVLNYAGAYTTFFTAFCTLGINSVIVKNFVDHPDESGETIGTTIVLRLLSSFLSIGVIVGIVSVVDKGDKLTVLVVFLYSLSLLFQVFDTFNYWFQSKLMSKYYAIATLISYLIASAYKVLMLSLHMSVEWFAVANSVDVGIVAVIMYIVYRKKGGPGFSVSFRKAKELLSVSCSYILSGLMVAIYAATDKVMLKHMLDESNVGYYSLAVSIATIWAFVLAAIIDSMNPSIMEYHNTDKEKYLIMNKRLYALVFYISIFASFIICLIAPLFVKVIYGEEFLPAVKPLRIVVWYVAFSYLGVARNAWIVCEKKQKYLKYIYLSSALINVVLNFVLIPYLGTSGAALASLLTQIATIFGVPAIIRPLRPNTKMILDAILLRDVIPAKSKTDTK